MGQFRRFLLICVLGLFYGILGTYSGADPFSQQPRIVVEDGHLTIRSAFNRNVSLSATGQGTVQINNVDMARMVSSGPSAGSFTSVNQRMTEILGQYRSLNNLIAQVNQLEENITDIAQRMNQFAGTDQNRITNRGIRRYFSKVKTLEEKVNTLTQLMNVDECSSNPCRNGGTCRDNYNGFICMCPSNWQGPYCEDDVNECYLYTGTGLGCQNGATCVNQPGSYRCDCATNFFGVHCTEQHDDCSIASHQELCGHGTCVNEKREAIQPGQPKYRCICDPGWAKSSNSPACNQDVNECQGTERKCSVNPPVECINIPGSFICGPCPVGYTGNGQWCADVNECEQQNGGCSINPRVECFNVPGSRRCGPCPTGYIGNGEYCVFTSVCSVANGGCHPLARCIENSAMTTNYRECRCPAGYVGSGEGPNGCFQSQAATCANSPCQHGTCQMEGQSYHCTCEAGYYGVHCEIQEDPCISAPCQNGGTCARTTGTSFNCICPDRYSGPTCDVEQRECGGRLYENNGTLHYPEETHTQEYSHSESCEWLIAVESGKVLNVTIDHFHLESAYHCEYDFLQINDGPNGMSRNMGRFCSNDLEGQTFTSTHNQMFFWFRSDRSDAGTGFTISWIAVDPVCGGRLNVSEYGALNSPGYPGNYPHNRNCSWLVQVPFKKRIQFSFATLRLEQHPNCSYDYLQIVDGASDKDPVLSTYCSTETPAPLITSGHTATLFFHTDGSRSDTGFHIVYSAVPAVQGCGDTLTAPQGIVSSPGFSQDSIYQNNLLCEWIIRIHPDNRMMLSFETFHLESQTSCIFDYLEIYDGSSEEAPLSGRFCGTDIPPDFLSNSNQVYIRFRTDSSQGFVGFRMNYKTVCGGVYTELTGYLTSPYFPDSYPADTTCMYEIHLPPGYLVNLTIHTLEIEDHMNCNFDFLEIRDGDSENSRQVAILCGILTEPVDSIISTYNTLWMKFKSDGTLQKRGFSAQYEAIEIGCGGMMTEDNGQISSHQDSAYYSHSTTCYWVIRAPEGYFIQLTFTSFELEGSDSCQYDYVLVEDINGVTIGTFCGRIIPPTITSMDNALLIKFVTDATVSLHGFIATYRFLDASQACGGNFYQESGVIRSPGYPNNYPHMANCVWVLHALNNRQILLNVTSFIIESHLSCNYDYLEIRNGGYDSSPLIGKYCGNDILPSIRSHSNTLWLQFKTDSSLSKQGFEIYFDSTSVGCGGTLTTSRGSIMSPNYPQPYPRNADCQWLIRASRGSRISLTIVDINIEEHLTCLHDYLQIFDGDSENSKSLARLCNNQQIPGGVVSSDNSLLLRFRSDFSEETGGFHVIYRTECRNILTNRRGVIESPNFPNFYPHNHNCSWMIQAPSGNNISISFSHLYIEGGGENCSNDYVEVMENRSVENEDQLVSLGKFCSGMSRPPRTIHTTSNYAVIQLITDRSYTSNGFRLEYTMNGCGGDIFGRYSGVITTPGYPSGYPHKTTCYWHIWYPPGSRIEFTIEDFDLETNPDCSFDFLKVYGGEDDNSPLLLNQCHVLNNKTITTHGNHLYLHFETDSSITSKGFRATFTKLESGCGGLFTADESTIMSPNYPEAYTETDDCEWLIEVSPSHLVVMDFIDVFSLPRSENCTQGYVAVYDGSNSSAPLLMKRCGEKETGSNWQVASTGNQMLVKLVSDGVHVGRGFKAHYKQGCGRRLLADSGGEIQSPNYPERTKNSVNCSWIIYASDMGEKVILTTTHLFVPSYDNCSYSSLFVFDGDMPDSPRISQFCGHQVPPPVISSGSIMHVFLQNHGIFRATYGVVSEHCGGSFKSVAGSFTSPGYPLSYDMNMECVWTIEASAGNKVHLTFQSFNLENSDYCNADYVEIHENDPSGVLIGKFCGNNIPSNVTSARKLWIKFRSGEDESTAMGFLAHYEMLHGSTINGSSGFIESPGYPQRYQQTGDYQWTVIVPNVTTYVSIQFLEMGIFSYMQSACQSYVQIFDGFGIESPDLGQFCGYQVPDPIISTSDAITILYHTVNYYPGVFRIQWSQVSESGVIVNSDSESSCLQEYELNITGTTNITSPNYSDDRLQPNRYYPPNYNCSYLIRTIYTHHVQLQFLNFSIEGSLPNCHFDSLQSFTALNPNVDSWILNSTLCGYLPEFQLSSPNNILKMVMTTDSRTQYSGFKALATAECGSHIYGSSGVLRSSSLLIQLQSLSLYGIFQCEWVITVKQRRTIRVHFEDFRIASDSSCSKSYIMLRNGASDTSPLMENGGTYCNDRRPSAYQETSSNNLYVKVFYKAEMREVPRFNLNYEEVSMTCGGHIFIQQDVLSTEISSPNYPLPPQHDIECEWIIVSPAGTRMRIDFVNTFHVGENYHCYYRTEGDKFESLEVRDGGTENAESLGVFCGEVLPSSVMSTGNALYVKYITNTDQPYQGFQADIKIASCGGTISSFHGQIASPNYPQDYGKSIECEWFLKMRFGYHITLTVTDFETPHAGNCSLTDFLQITEMNPEGQLGDVITTICGHPDNLPIVIDVPGPFAYVKFKSDSSMTAKGFDMKMSVSIDEGCGGILHDPSGVITSPRYPNALLARRDCFWRIYAPLGRKVKITFNALNLPIDESLNTCSSYVFVTNITRYFVEHDATLQHQYCGNIIPPEIDSSSNIVYIEFHTRALSAGQGFSLSYSTEEEAACGGLLPSPSGVLQTPDFPGVREHSRMECLWRVDIEPNNTLTIKFDLFDIPGSQGNYCRSAALWISTEFRYLSQHCGNFTNGLRLTSPYASTQFRLITSLDKPFRGLHGTYNVSDCGGRIDGSNAVIMSPNYPNNYPQSIDCHWILTVMYGETIQLVVEDLHLEEDCTKDYLLIKNGMREDSPVIGRFCGQQNVMPITSSDYALAVIFHSDEFGSASGFKLTTTEVQRGCGGLIHMLQGNVTSPKYPSKYENNVECVWTIEYSLGYLVSIEFIERFDIEMDATCSKDYLQFEDFERNGTWTLRDRKCGSARPNTFVSKSNKLKVTFRSNENRNFDGFVLKYTAVCGGNFTDVSGDILSINYPDKYQNLLSCRYVIGQLGDYVTLSFEDFSIEGPENCPYDYVEIFQQIQNESNSQGKFCGDTVPAERSLQGPVFFTFVTDSYYASHGFKLHYEITSCGSVLTAKSGIIKSPGSFRHYISSIDCTWRITTEPGRPIALRFIYFDVDLSGNCYRSYLSIREGNESGHLITKLCGKNTPTVKSDSNQLTLRYRQSRYVQSRGFSLYYYSTYGPADGCGGTLRSTSGEINSVDIDSDGHYEPNLDCGWKIMTSTPDQVIKINFTRFDLDGTNDENCTTDYVELRESGATGSLLGRYCGSNIPSNFISSSDEVFVHFHSDEVDNRSGFQIKYTVVTSICGASALTALPSNQTLKSPNYPNPYPGNLRCRWIISTNYSLGHWRRLLQISVIDLDIPCGGDRLEIKPFIQGFHQYDALTACGAKYPHVMDFRRGAIVVFQSSAVNSRSRGFSLSYKDTSCSRNYTDDGSVIMNTNYPETTNMENRCQINITASAGRTVSLYFKLFQMYTSDTHLSYLKIYDGDNVTAPLIQLSNSYLPDPIFSTGRSLFMDISMPRYHGRYHITFTTTNAGRGCGGNIFGPEGIISSPLYPQTYNITGECLWHITVPGYHVIKLDFETFSLNSTSGCNSNFVEIFTGAAADISSRIARYCGSDVPANQELRSNQAVVKLVTDETNSLSGFLLRFSSSTTVVDTGVNLIQRDED